jgi:uncharacterized protein GlcG (DUF336 family)
MMNITLDQANRIIDGALAKGAELGLRPLGVAVLDAGGKLVAFQLQDNSSTLRPQIAIGKASGALALGISSRKIADLSLERPGFVIALGEISREGVIPAAGGVIIVDSDGRVLGAVGITGDSSDNDEICAFAGIAAAGLAAQR